MRLLILCTGNSCRSQMAEGWFRHFAGDRAEVYSAGVEAHGVNPKAVQAMAEVGIDLAVHTSNVVDEYLHLDFDHVVTVCDNARERCPVFPNAVGQRHHHAFRDPAKATGTPEAVWQVFQEVRDEIRDYAAVFVAQHLRTPQAA